MNKDLKLQKFRLEIGTRLWALRNANGVSQEKFADSIGATQSVYHKWERGDNFPNELHVRVICEKYSVDFNYIYAGDLKPFKKKEKVMLNNLIEERLAQMA